MNRRDRFLRLAEVAAAKSKSPVRVGAILVDGSRVVSIGVNDMTKTHPLYYPANLHAELDAIIAAPYVSGCDIYIVRLLKNGRLAPARPCRRCETLLKRYNVKRIVTS